MPSDVCENTVTNSDKRDGYTIYQHDVQRDNRTVPTVLYSAQSLHNAISNTYLLTYTLHGAESFLRR
jgi:hypothetical protein